MALPCTLGGGGLYNGTLDRFWSSFFSTFKCCISAYQSIELHGAKSPQELYVAGGLSYVNVSMALSI